MPYPMVKGNIEERWTKSIEDHVGLPIDLIKKLDSNHMSFYLQNRDNMSIKQNDSGQIEYTLRGMWYILNYYEFKTEIEPKTLIKNLMNGQVILNENEFDNYLEMIHFRGPKIDTEYRIDGIPESRFITSEQINQQLDDSIKRISRN